MMVTAGLLAATVGLVLPQAYAGDQSSASAPASKAAASTSSHAGMNHAQAAPRAFGDDPDGDGYIPANPPVSAEPSQANPPHRYFHEFQAHCSVTHTAPDDPIVFPGQPGASHDHTFMGNVSTNGNSTSASMDAANGTTCVAPGDKSGYWMPSLYKGDKKILPVDVQTIYYKAGVTDYTSVRPFPKGLRFLVGSPMQTAQEFRNHKGFVEGWECGESYFNTEFPASCPTGQDVQLNIRFQAPSCWDGKYLDTPNHTSHMAYPVVKAGTNDNVCPADHPVALPMIEFKMAWPVNGDTSDLRLASGAAHTFHYDFFNAWDNATLKAMVDHCIVGGLQCDPRGYDQTHPEAGAALDENYELPS
ncbi:secreted protein [Streptomyces sp. SPB78]|nr:secreted protein [Streptomyces sp. SPB78]